MKIVVRKEIEISEKRLARKFYNLFNKFLNENPGYGDDIFDAFHYFCSMELCGFAEAEVNRALGGLTCDYDYINELENKIEDRCEEIILKEG